MSAATLERPRLASSPPGTLCIRRDARTPLAVTPMQAVSAGPATCPEVGSCRSPRRRASDVPHAQANNDVGGDEGVRGPIRTSDPVRLAIHSVLDCHGRAACCAATRSPFYLVAGSSVYFDSDRRSMRRKVAAVRPANRVGGAVRNTGRTSKRLRHRRHPHPRAARARARSRLTRPPSSSKNTVPATARSLPRHPTPRESC